MSIWSTIIDIGPVQDVGYAPSVATGGYVDVASAGSWYGGQGLRLYVEAPSGLGECVLSASIPSLIEGPWQGCGQRDGGAP